MPISVPQKSLLLIHEVYKGRKSGTNEISVVKKKGLGIHTLIGGLCADQCPAGIAADISWSSLRSLGVELLLEFCSWCSIVLYRSMQSWYWFLCNTERRWQKWTPSTSITLQLKDNINPYQTKIKLCLWNTNPPEMAIFSKTVILIFDLDWWPWIWYPQKGLVTRYKYVKYESSITYCSKAMVNVQDFADKQTGQKQ